VSGIGWVDWLLLAALLLSVLVGLWRGFVLEVLALAGWVVAYFTAHWAAPMWAPHLPIGEPRSNLNFVAAFALAFIITLVLWGLASRLVRLLVNATPLRGVDRVLGAAFGVARGLVLLLVLATVVSLTPAAQSPEWRGSQGAWLLADALQQLKPHLPDGITRLLPADTTAPQSPNPAAPAKRQPKEA
jgi:membrane protein required for colicin V production